MVESALITKLRNLNKEYENIDTTPERKYIIQEILKGVQRDLQRLGLKDDPEVLKSYGITNSD
jgi:hypothetical protein